MINDLQRDLTLQERAYIRHRLLADSIDGASSATLNSCDAGNALPVVLLPKHAISTLCQSKAKASLIST
jgi:hypothetical protein